MLLELLHKALFALISGFSELIFVSTTAHQLLYRTVTGYELFDALLSLGVHLGCMIALISHCQKRIRQLKSEKRLVRPERHRRGRQPDIASLMDIRILNTAAVPLLCSFLLYSRGLQWISDPLRFALVLSINGVILFLPRLLSTGNKNGRSFTQLDGLLMGLAGALSVIPGFSRLGCMYSVGVARGAGKHYALELSMLLTIPALVVMSFFDGYRCIVASGTFTGMQVLGALIAVLMSYIGARMGIGLLRLICTRSNTVGFAYYNWGLAIFMMLIYLFVS